MSMVGEDPKHEQTPKRPMTSRPAAPESETPETDALLKARPALWDDWNSADLHALEMHARFLERRLSLAQTEIKGHMRVVDELKLEVIALNGIIRVRTEALAQAQARIAELEKDAARYRWLRDNPYKKSVRMLDEHVPEELGAAIDAALKSRA